MILDSFVLYLKWLIPLIFLAIFAYFLQYPVFLIFLVCACIFVPVDRVRLVLIKKSEVPPGLKNSWTLILLFTVIPLIFGVLYSFTVELTGDLQRPNVVVIWLLFFGVFPLCLYSFWFFNVSSWLKAHKRLTNKQ
jgi:hypothetical protein